ncbi:MAG: TetR/AcrR family transcriptional regulator [Haliea sp.]|jgi:AcrR family transcriptional regulator|nr:TetR/AcrR family transcriptional regulator [Haliea sp.]
MPDKQFSALNYDDPMVARILDAGEQCIHRFGIRRTSMGEVARVGKLSRGSIYRYFSAKEALVEGIIRRRQEAFLNRTEALLEKETRLVDKLTLAVLAGRKDMQEGIFAALAEVEPETLAMMFLDPRFYHRSVSFWPPHVRLAQEAGEVAAALDVVFVTDFIVRLAVSLVMFPTIEVDLRSRKSLHAYLQQALRMGLGENGL